LTRPLVETLAGLIAVAAVSDASLGDTSGLIIWVWAAWGLLLLRLIWKIAQWAVEFLIVTPDRLSLSSGLLSRRVAFIPIAKVADMSLQQPFLGRLLGYGELVLELPGQDQETRIIDHVPYSDRLYLELSTWICSRGQI